MFKIEPFETLASFQNQINEVIYNPTRNTLLILSGNEIVNLELEGNKIPIALPDEIKVRKNLSKLFYKATKNLMAIIFDDSLYVLDLNAGEITFKTKCKTDKKNFSFNKVGNIIAFNESNSKIQISWLKEKRKKVIKDIDDLNELIFSQDTINFPFLIALGEETSIISYDNGKILSRIYFPSKQGIFTKNGDRLFLLGKETNSIRVYQSHKLDSDPKILNEILPKLRGIHSILLTPDDRILVGLSSEGLELWDITIPEQEVSLIWSKKQKKIINGIFFPNGQLFTSNSSGEIIIWNEPFILEDIRGVFKKFNDKVEEIKVEFRRIPQWVIDGNIDTLERMDLETVERIFKETKNIVDPPILLRFQPPDFSYWVEEVFKEDIILLSRIEEKSVESLKILEDHVQKLRKKFDEKRERHQRMLERCIFYLKSFATGTKVPIEQIANYLSVSSDEVTTFLRLLEREKRLPPGRLVSNIFGRLDFVSGYETVVSSNLQIEKTDIYSCYYCANSIISVDTHCTSCQKEVLKCKSCNIPITRNQEKIDCKYCNNAFHFLCYIDKVKVFSRCPHCKKELTKDEVENQFYKDTKEKARVSSSLGRMLQIKKSIKKENKNPFDF
jgi:hypothetical protein